MLSYNTYYNQDEEGNEQYPVFFYEWDNSVRKGKKPGFYSAEDLLEIIEIYLEEEKIDNARQVVDFALALHGADEDLVCDIMLIMDEYELWNDLLEMSERYSNITDEYGECNKIISLLHLGMEEDAFHFFGTLKKKYAGDSETLTVIYTAMGEALLDLDLFESSDEVMLEAIRTTGENDDYLWIRLQCLVALKDNEAAIEIAEKIQQKNPLDGELWRRMGEAFQELGEKDRAIDAYENALSLDHDPQTVLLKLIFAYEDNENPAKALERLNEYMEQFESSYYLFFTAAKLCSQLEDWTAALAYINQAISLEPSADESVYMYKSHFLLQLDEKLKAKLALAEGIENTTDPYGKLRKELLKLNKKFPKNS